MEDQAPVGAGALPLDETEPAQARQELRLWLRLLTCTTLVEGEIRSRLRDRFATTLPRFDALAQLDRAPDGLTMGELSRRMMVSNGNVTGLAGRLEALGWVARAPAPADRRTQVVRLTPVGRAAFRRMAAAHERWVAGLFAGLAEPEIDQLMRLLARTKASVRAAAGREA